MIPPIGSIFIAKHRLFPKGYEYLMHGKDPTCDDPSYNIKLTNTKKGISMWVETAWFDNRSITIKND